MPAPSNDNFANATTLSTSLPGSLTGETNVDATYETGEPLCTGFGGSVGTQSVWYSFTPTSTGRYRFRLTGLADGWTDVRAVNFAMYSGSAVNALTEMLYDNRTSPNTPNYVFDFWIVIEALLTASTTYYIRVAAPTYTGDTGNEHTVNFDLAWESQGNPSAPANDNFANAVDLGTDPTDGVVATVSTIGATDDSGGFAYYIAAPTVWYKFHCATTETQAIHLVRDGADSEYLPYWEIYKKNIAGTPTSFTDLDYISFGDLDGGAPYTVGDDAYNSVSLVAGEDYWILVADWQFNGVGGGADLYFGAPPTPPAAPANDVRTDLNSVPLFAYWPWYLGKSEFGDPYPSFAYWSEAQAGHVSGTTISATADAGDPTIAGFAATRSVWYVLDTTRTANYRVWVESSVDCVLGVFQKNNGTTLGALVAEDDDSGAGNWPEVTFFATPNDYWIAVDSKTEGDFVLKWEMIGSGTPPANDDFANATVISSVPYSASGTTINATAEAEERECFMMGTGPKDTVWYKFVASGNGILKIKCTVQSTNGGPDSGQTAVAVDLWHGTTLENLVRHPEPPTNLGYFNHFDTAAEIEQQAVYLNYTNGETYYIRVQTPGGGSEDFTIYVDELAINLDLSVQSQEGGPYNEVNTVPLRMTPSATIVESGTLLDSGTVALLLTPGAAWETQGRELTDSNVVYLTLSPLGGECFSRFHFTGEGEADLRWEAIDASLRWGADADPRWTLTIDIQPGCH